MHNLDFNLYTYYRIFFNFIINININGIKTGISDIGAVGPSSQIDLTTFAKSKLIDLLLRSCLKGTKNENNFSFRLFS